ncbi:MAG: polysaccharide biosynthesis tyrosine autokinase [Hyphomicrobiaceae bacterium]|nr:MAG: polysaccharide biosynthesis tyrosine autokinase [Hyphomicrobiaceae bacterium]
MDQHMAMEPRPGIDIQSIYLMLRRHIRLLAAGALLGAVLAFAMLVVMRPQYTAVATLMADSRQEKVFNSDAVISRIEASSAAIASEAAVITAPSVLKRVVEKLELAKDPDFAVRKHTPGMLGSAKAWVFALFGVHARVAVDGGGLNEEAIALIDKLRKSMEVNAVQYTNLINVSVTSKDPNKAARIANAVVDAYLIQQIEGRYLATRRATDWLTARLEEHKLKLRQSEERFERAKAEMDLVDKEGTTLEEKQLVRLNEELVLARARTAEARAKYFAVLQQANGRNIDDQQLAEFVQSALITQLRTQLAQVIRDEDSLNSRFGSNHPAVVKVRAERRGLNSQIGEEVRRIVAVLKNDYEVSDSREKSLAESLKAAAEKTSGQRGEYVKLRELQRETESDKALYEAMLQRVKQTAAQETWKSTDFRIVAEAVPPLSSSQPKTKVLAFAGLSLGLGLGLGLTLLTELLDTTFKRGRDVEAKLSIPHLVDVPLLPARQLSMGGPTRTPAYNAFHFAAQHVGTPFADSMLGLHAALQAAGSNRPMRTVMFTSATPEEGKSVMAANYAQLAARSGLKVLLICTDLRTPTVNWFAPDTEIEHDLVDYLQGDAEIESVIARNGQMSIDLIPAGRSATDAATLLSSPRMQKLIEWGKVNYDLVVIDTVAIVTCLDGRMLARHIDATVLVVEWLKTKLDMAKEAVELLVKNDARIVGAVLNKVDFTKARLYGLTSA